MTLTPKPHGFELRLRYGAGKRDRFLLATQDETLAHALEPRMEAMARKLATQPDAGRALLLLREAALSASDPKKFATVERVVEKLCVEAAAVSPPAVASAPSTFAQVVDEWCSGRLTRDYPDHQLLPEKTKAARDEDRAILSVFFPALGNRPIASITPADIDAARRLIPKKAHANTRRKYALKLRMILRLAESPLRLVERTPHVDIPRRAASNLFGFLYPQEEAQLIAHTPIPLAYRVLYGYLARNGCRIGESLRLTWDHVDLQTGDIHIDRKWTKTKRARRWVLDADVLEALEAYHRVCGEPKGGAPVFVGRGGKRLSPVTVRKRFLQDLTRAGITRRSILEGGDGIDALRVHDLRASFVTLALRAGRDLKWIMTRTGHETLGVLQVYDRLVQDANEHHLPKWFSPMAQAIPELRPRRQGGPSVGQTAESSGFVASNPRSLGTDELGKTGEKHREKAPSVTPQTPLIPTSGPAENKGVGQNPPSGPPSAEVPPEPTESPVERALAAGLTAALAAEQWELAQTIVQELGERRRARTAPSVPSLADARRKRDGEKP